MFSRKHVNSNEYETLYKRIIDVEQRVRALELNEEDLRNKVLRKIQKRDETPKRQFAIPTVRP